MNENNLVGELYKSIGMNENHLRVAQYITDNNHSSAVVKFALIEVVKIIQDMCDKQLKIVKDLENKSKGDI